jgi:hypothetical protein
MKKNTIILLASLTLSLTGCNTVFPYAPKVGSSENSFLRNTLSFDLVYLEGSVKAYRANGSYYYFKDNKLVKVVPELLSADKI